MSELGEAYVGGGLRQLKKRWWGLWLIRWKARVESK